MRVKCTNTQKKLCKKKNCENKELRSGPERPDCPKRSFENNPKAEFWSEKNEKKPRDICKSSAEPIWFNCNICPHKFQSKLYSITAGQWCPFCCNPPRKVCKNECDFCKKNSFASHPKAIFWSEKNQKKPREVLKSSRELVWFNCRHGHEFKSQLANIKKGRWCPGCNNKTEQKLFEWLTKNYPSFHIIKQFKTPWCKNPGTNRGLPFDFLIESLPPKWASLWRLNLIIELDGEQHFRQVLNWKDPAEARKRDIYKMNQALLNG